MSQQSPPEMLDVEDGVPAPFCVIPFDRHGVCVGPERLEEVTKAAAHATDIFVFSHGWNNDWGTAISRYRDFIACFAAERSRHWHPPSRDYRPVLIGLFWPSTALVAPWEKAPEIAGASGIASELAERAEVRVLAEELPGADAARLRALAALDGLADSEAEEFATILAPILAGKDEVLEAAPSPEELMQVWEQWACAGATYGEGEEGGFIDDRRIAGPVPANLLKRLDPRQIIRVTTVLVMKDRAGKVGGAGVAFMLRNLLEVAPIGRIHLVGHSYGCKVLLSALCVDSAPIRPVESVLLLQPAVSSLCFAVDADGEGHSGGYRPALERVRQPILTTFSRRDIPLTRLFHLAVRRRSDLGEALIAGAPSRFAALGGFGPRGAPDDTLTVSPRVPPDGYSQAGEQTRIIAVRADDVIHGHGDVINPATAWALLCQVMR